MAALLAATVACASVAGAAALDPLCAPAVVAAAAASLKHPAKKTHTSACRVLPSETGRAAMALVFVRPDSESAAYVHNAGILHLEVVVVGADGKVLQRLKRADVFDEEQMRFDGVSLDTGHYYVSPGIRAFGVRSRNVSFSPVAPQKSERLTLYVGAGSALRAILSDLQTHSLSGLRRDECDEELSEVGLTLDFGTESIHGFRDLIVTRKAFDSAARMVGKACERTSTKPVITRHTLRYDGKQYVVPPDLN